MTTISEGFGDFSISINHQQILAMENMVVHFVLRRTHPLTFDGPYLGCDPVAFTTSDYNALFDIFGLHKKDVETKIKDIKSIDRNFIVTSDPFNLLSVWLVHLAPIYIKDKNIQREFMMNVLRYYHYKIFTSVVNNAFRHGANRGIMEATISSLSRKSDIIRYESWKKLIDSHCEKIIDPKDRFWNTVVDGAPDDLFLRVISESQTALRSKIVTFANAYYEAHAAGDSVGFKSSVSENEDGEKILTQVSSVIDSVKQGMVTEILNVHMFIHDISIHDIGRIFSTISENRLKQALLKINETAVLQTSGRTFDEVKVEKDGTLYIGIRVLIFEIIRSMIRICREKRVNLGNRALVFKTIKDAYSSSRNLDTDVIAVKKSVAYHVDSFNLTSNEAAKAALRLGVIYYICYRAIQKMKT